MKYFLLVFTILSFNSFSQMIAVGPTTIIPQNPTVTDYVKFVTNVTTNYQGVVVDLYSNVTANSVRLHGCYGQLMLPATQTFIDTFSVGYLPAGPYTLYHEVYLSSANQHCQKVDSVKAQQVFTVAGPVFITEERPGTHPILFPNPCKEKFFVNGSYAVKIFSVTGTLVCDLPVGRHEIDICHLPEGLYFVQLIDKGKRDIFKILKANF